MSDDIAEVRLGADISDLKSGLDSASNSVKSSMDSISSSIEGMAASTKGSTEGMLSAFDDLGHSIKSALDGLSESLGPVGAAIAAFGGFEVAGKLVEGFIEKIHELGSEILGLKNLLEENDSVRKLEISFGMAAEEAVKLSAQLHIAGVSTESYQGMAMKVGRTLRTNSDEFDRLGVKTKDSAGALLPMNEIMQNAYVRMQDFKAGTDQTLFAMSIFGRNATQVANDFQRIGASADDAKEGVKRFGASLEDSLQAELEQIMRRTEVLKMGFEEMGQHIEESILPVKAEMIELGISIEEQVIHIIDAIKRMADQFPIAGQAISAMWHFTEQVIIGTVGVIATGLNAINVMISVVIGAFKMLYDAAHFNFSGVNKDFDVMQKNVSADVAKMVTDLNSLRNAIASVGQEGPIKLAGAPLPKSGKEGYVNKPKGGGGGGGDERMAAWRDELVKKQEAEGYFNEFSKKQEAEFWEAKLAMVNGYGKEDVKIRQELNRLIFADKKAMANEELQADLSKWKRMSDAAINDKQTQIGIAEARTATMLQIYGKESKQYETALDEELKMRQSWVQKEAQIMKTRTDILEQAATHQIAMEQLALDQSVKLRQVSDEDKLSKEVEFENRLYAMKMKGLQDEQSLLDNRTNAWLEVEKKIEGLEQEHQKKLTTISNDAEQSRMAFMTGSQAAFESGFGGLLNNLMTGTMSWKKAFLQAAQQITSAIDKLAADAIAKQLFGGGSSGGNALGNIFGMLGFGGGGSAATIFGGTDSSQLASGGGFSLDSGFSIPSFDVGTPYVPQTGLALIHQGERIVTAKDNSNGKYGSNPTSINNHFTINGPADARTQAQIAAQAGMATKHAMNRNT